MSTEQSQGRGRWRGEKPRSSAPTRGETITKKWVGATILSLLFLSVAAVIVWLCFIFLFPRKPQPTFVPFLVSSYQRPQIPPIPELEPERSALQKSQIFPIVDSTEDPYGNSTLDVMKTRLENLAQRKAGKGIVVYIAAYAMVSGTGDVQILAYDSDPYSPGTLLPLQVLLNQLRACPERHKLLVLDIMKSSPYPFDLGGTPDGVADLILKELQDEKNGDRLVDPNLLVLVACSPGQFGLWSETLHESVFGHYFRAAFADPSADSIEHNGSLSVRELAAHLARKVDDWAIRYRGTRQTPYLVGEAQDFDLAVVTPGPDGAEPKPVEKEQPEPVAKDAAQEKDGEPKKSGEEKESKVAAKEASRKSGEQAASEQDAKPGDYPDWLVAGWQLHQDWLKDNGNRDFQGAFSPRVFRRLEASLLRAERAWRGGLEPTEIRESLAADVKQMQKQMEIDSKIPRPQAMRSAGQARAFGWQADESLVSKLRNLIETQRTIQTASDPKAAEAAQKKGADEVITALKSKPNPSVELAGTIAEATREQRLDPGTILFLDTLVNESKLGLDVVELRILRDLADRARVPGPQGWSEDAVGLAWKMIALAEEAASRPRSFPWVRKMLDQAQNARHEAQVLLLSQAREFVSWERIRQSCEPVIKDLMDITAFQDRIEEAQTLLNRSRATLPAYLPYLYAIRRTDLDGVWLNAAEATVTLDRRLQKPAPRGVNSPGRSRDELEQLNGELTADMGAVKSALAQLDRPFQADSIREVLHQVESGPEPRAAAEIEALLTTPFLKVKDRVQLWKAGRVLERKLGERPARDEKPTEDSAPEAHRVDVARGQVARRARRLESLLRLTGSDVMASDLGGSVKLNNQLNALDRASSKDDATRTSALAQNWAGLANVAALVFDSLMNIPAQPTRMVGDDRIGWVAPPFLLNLASGSTRPSREKDALANWDWLAAFYRHQARDLHETLEPEQFYTNAAEECPRSGGATSQANLALSVDAALIPILSASQPQTIVSVKVDAGAVLFDDSQKVRLKPLQIGDPRLQVRLRESDEIELSRQNPFAMVPIDVEWDEDRGHSDAAPPKGFMLQARLPDDRTFHLLVPVRFEWRAIFPKLALSSTKDKLTEVPIDRFALRTLPGASPSTCFW